MRKSYALHNAKIFSNEKCNLFLSNFSYINLHFNKLLLIAINFCSTLSRVIFLHEPQKNENINALNISSSLDYFTVKKVRIILEEK